MLVSSGRIGGVGKGVGLGGDQVPLVFLLLLLPQDHLLLQAGQWSLCEDRFRALPTYELTFWTNKILRCAIVQTPGRITVDSRHEKVQDSELQILQDAKKGFDWPFLFQTMGRYQCFGSADIIIPIRIQVPHELDLYPDSKGLLYWESMRIRFRNTVFTTVRICSVEGLGPRFFKSPYKIFYTFQIWTSLQYPLDICLLNFLR